MCKTYTCYLHMCKFYTLCIPHVVSPPIQAYYMLCHRCWQNPCMPCSDMDIIEPSQVFLSNNNLLEGENLKGVLCGRFLEVTTGGERVHSGMMLPPKSGGKGKEPETEESIKERAAARARRTVRRICNCNNMVYMHTLTFAVEHIKYFQGEKPFSLIPVEEQKKRDRVIEIWKAFARKMRAREKKKGREFRYIAVIERHKGKRAKDTSIKSGCFHVHFVSDRLYNKRLLQHHWGHGLCNHSDWTQGRKERDLDNADTLPPPDNPGAYLSKYIGKDAEDTERGRKSYWASRNLNKPIKVTGYECGTIAQEGREIYRRDRTVTTTDGLSVRYTTLTYSLDSSTRYVERGGVRDFSEKAIRERRARVRLQVYKLRELKQRRQIDAKRKDILRDAGQAFVSGAIERDGVFDQQTRDFNATSKMESSRAKENHSRMLYRIKTRKRAAKIKALGIRRYFQRCRTAGVSRVFKSYNEGPTGL